MNITQKAIKVIESCKNMEQLESAKKYANLAMGINRSSSPVLTLSLLEKEEALEVSEKGA